MAKRKISHQYVTFFKKTRINRDGSRSILAMVRVPKNPRFSKTFKTQEEAEAWAFPRAEKLIKDKERGRRSADPTLTIARLINLYLDDPKTEELKSYEDYADRANWWKEHYGSEKVMEVDELLLNEARNKLRRTGRFGTRSAATVNRHLAVMQIIWNWGMKHGVPRDQPWPEDLRMKEPRGRTRFLTQDELSGLLKAAEVDPLVRAAILVSIATGLRQGELLRLKWTDIDFISGHATIFESKNGTARRVHLTSQAVAALETLKAADPFRVFTLEDGRPLRQPQLEMRWRRIREAAGLVDFRWHDLRHTTASYLAQNGASALQIAEVLGHKTLQMVKRYTHLVQGAPVTGHAALDDMLKGA